MCTANLDRPAAYVPSPPPSPPTYYPPPYYAPPPYYPTGAPYYPTGAPYYPTGVPPVAPPPYYPTGTPPPPPAQIQATATYGITIDIIAEGSVERASFERGFKDTMAAALGGSVNADDVTINFITAGSVIVSRQHLNASFPPPHGRAARAVMTLCQHRWPVCCQVEYTINIIGQHNTQYLAGALAAVTGLQLAALSFGPYTAIAVSTPTMRPPLIGTPPSGGGGH